MSGLNCRRCRKNPALFEYWCTDCYWGHVVPERDAMTGKHTERPEEIPARLRREAGR